MRGLCKLWDSGRRHSGTDEAHALGRRSSIEILCECSTFYTSLTAQKSRLQHCSTLSGAQQRNEQARGGQCETPNERSDHHLPCRAISLKPQAQHRCEVTPWSQFLNSQLPLEITDKLTCHSQRALPAKPLLLAFPAAFRLSPDQLGALCHLSYTKSPVEQV